MPVESAPVSSFSACENTWGRLNPTEQSTLREASLHILDTPQGTLDEVVPADRLAELESKGALIQKDGEWRLSPPQMPLFIRAVCLIDSLGLDSRPADESFQELARVLRQARDQPLDPFNQQNEVMSFVVARLINTFGRTDVLELMLSEDTEPDLFWQFHRPVCDAVPILHLTAESFAGVFRQIIERTQGDMAGGRILQAAEQLGLLRPGVGQELVDLLSTIEDWETVGVLGSMMAGVAHSSADHLDHVIDTCASWLSCDSERLCQAAVRCSQKLVLHGKLDPDWLLPRVELLIPQSTESIRYAISHATTTLGARLPRHSVQCLGMMTRLKEQESSGEVTHAIAGAMSYRDNVAPEYITSCLSLLADVPTENRETIQRIADFLYSVARSRPREVWSYLEQWVLAHDPREGSVAEHGMFRSAINEAYQADSNLAVVILTRWLASPDQRLVEEARRILQELKVGGLAPQEIAAMPPYIIKYLTEKLLIGHFEGIHLMRLLHSILMHTSRFERLEQYFLQVLREVTWNYPGSAREFYESAIGEEDATPSSTLLRQTRQELEEYQRQHGRVFVPELAPSRYRVQKYLELEAKKMKALQQGLFNDGQFPLQRLLPRVAIGRGDRTFHMEIFHPDPAQRRTFTQPQGFSQISESIELPRAEITDPEGEAWKRLRRLGYTPDDFLEDE